jgi:hypothetical protein
MRNERTLEKILAAFAEAVEAGEYREAEGWMAVAAWARGRILVPAAPIPAR